MNQIKVTEHIFGYMTYPEDNGTEIPVKRYTLSNDDGMEVSVINYGAAINTLKVPDGSGNIQDVILGFDNIQGYLREYSGGYNSVAGRVASFIANGSFTLDGKAYNVSKNHRGHCLHGGSHGFHTKIWDSKVTDEKKLQFTYVSQDGEEGFPGKLEVKVIYELTQDNQLILNMEGVTDKATPVNLTSHCHFNLSGHEAANCRLINHLISINSDKYTVPDSNGIPNGLIQTVAGTTLDLTNEKSLNDLLEAFPPGPNGFNTNYCLNGHSSELELNLAARVSNTATRILLEVFTNQPCVQFYTGQHWPDPDKSEEAITGKGGAKYMKFGFFALETQKYPNAVNVESFPSTILYPGQKYKHTVVYKFQTF